MSRADRITAVFFDWDYTLAYTRTPHNTLSERLAKMFRLAHLPYTQSAIEAAWQQYEAAKARGQIPSIDHPQTRREIAHMYRYLLQQLGHPDRSWPLLIRLYGTYAMLPTYLYADARPTLRRLAARGYKLGVLSNHSRSVRPVIEELVGDLVPAQHIVISEEEGIHKPAVTIFRRAAARLRVAPQACLLVGDNFQVDAVASVSTGGFGQGVWLNRQVQALPQPTHRDVMQIVTLDQLADYLS